MKTSNKFDLQKFEITYKESCARYTIGMSITKENAYKTAIKFFNSKNYKEILSEFLFPDTSG